MTYTFLYSNSLNGIGPSGGVEMDAHGNLYGTTWLGGSGGCTLGCGVVFELSPPRHRSGAWTLAVLYNFQLQPDGSQPESALVMDVAGNSYGTTVSGGTGHCGGGCGTVFQLAPPAQKGRQLESHWYTVQFYTNEF